MIRLLLLAATLVSAAAQAAVDVHLSVDTHAEGGPGVQKAPPDRHDEIDATLGDNWMIVRDGGHTRFFDFAKRRQDEIDEATHTRTDFSLYSAAGFRIMELTNRRNLAQAMAAAKITQVPFDPVEAENALAIQDTPGRPLKMSVDGDSIVFMNAAHVMARESRDSTPVPPAQARMFAQLVRYTWGGHPQILAALAQAGAIPATFTLSTINIGSTTTTIQATAARPSTTGPIDIAAIAPRAEADATTPVERLLARGDAFSAADIAASRDKVREQIAAAFADKRPLEAWLGIMEWMLSTGEPPPPLDAAQKAMIGADPSFAALSAALAPHPDKQDMQQAVERLDGLRPHAGSHGYMIDLFVANDRATLGDRRAAIGGLVAVLQAHPFIAGAYKDLGDNLLLTYEAPEAWRSWDLGRRIAPTFHNFKAVGEFEARLAAQHPEYF